MNVSDEDLIAYVDGELDPGARAAIEDALVKDRALASRVERHRALRHAVESAFRPVLGEPMPQRLLHLARGNDAPDTALRRRSALGWGWLEWGAMAASLAIGVFAGSIFLNLVRPVSHVPAIAGQFDAGPDGMVARGALARALTEQLASVQPADAPIRIGLSFVSREGEYCRTFALARLGGLACRSGGEWRLPVLAQAERGGGEYGRAGSGVPLPVSRAVDERMQGSALDAEGERAARQRGWEHERAGFDRQ